MSDEYRQFGSKEDILQVCDELEKKEHLLDKYLEEIVLLKRGKVKPKETLRRAKLASYFTSTIQQINNYVDKETIYLTRKTKDTLSRMVQKADKVLRENIVLQTIPPLDVIHFEHVPIRHSYSFYGGRERRWGYAFHMNPFNEEGNSVTLAEMPPRYTQSIHNHTVSEYCHILDSRTEGIYYPGGIREKIVSTHRHEILHFSATTPHTLRNPSDEPTRNITFKQARALTDWRPASNLNEVKTVRARLIRGKVSRMNETQTVKKFRVLDRFYDYTLEVMRFEKGSVYSNEHPFDRFIFVTTGRLKIQTRNIVKKAKRNDFIVIDKNTPYTITTSTLCRLYTVKY